jgi:peptidoglycan/LPS O-acetylase OafA/YrhL
MHAPVPSVTVASGPRLSHLAGLDGLRALAIAAVFVYHAAPAAAPGGFLGVSLFFTVSGYLIGSLLLAEVEGTGRVDLGRFWARRGRRLLPALLLTLAAVTLLATRLPVPSGFRGEALAALGYVANWHAVWAGLDYADLFATPSPVAHLWSLAIEEQFYLVFPVLVAAVVARGGSPRSRLAALAAAGCAASLAAQLFTDDRALGYYGTHVRAAELCAGVLLATSCRPGTRVGGRWRAAVTLAGAAGLAATTALVLAVDLGDGWLYQGGFTALGGLWAVLVLACAASPLSVVLGWGPLAAVGRVSYGLYLAHWPVIVWLDEQRTGVDGFELFLLQAFVTAGVAALSYHLLEQPVRERRIPRRPAQALPALGVAFGVAFAVVAAAPAATRHNPLAIEAASGPVAFPVPTSLPLAPGTLPPAAPDAPPPSAPTRAATRSAPGNAVSARAASAAPVPATAPTTVPPTTAAPAPPVLAFVGDSVPYLAAEAIAGKAAQTGFVPLNLALPNCDGAAGHPKLRLGYGEVIHEAEGCGQWVERWSVPLSQGRPAAFVLMLGQTTVLDRRVDDEWQGPCDAEFQAWYEPTVAARVEWLAANAPAPIYLAVTPWAAPAAVGIVPQDHLERTNCLNTLYDRVRATHPDVRRLDVAAWLCPQGPETCAPVRSDGLHFSEEGAVQFATWVRGQLTRDGVL